MRSIKKQQQYWAIGQTVAGHVHVTPREGVYAWLTYYTKGIFDNELTAVAKSPATTPQSIAYTNHARMSYRHISIGWRHYLKGSSDAESSWNVYGYSGLGLMLGKVENTHSTGIDSSMYTVPVLSGKAHFKRLTLDLGLGFEIPLNGDIYFYTEGRTIIPTTDYPSDHIYINKYAPLTAAINLGFRIFFE